MSLLSVSVRPKKVNWRRLIGRTSLSTQLPSHIRCQSRCKQPLRHAQGVVTYSSRTEPGRHGGGLWLSAERQRTCRQHLQRTLCRHRLDWLSSMPAVPFIHELVQLKALREVTGPGWRTQDAATDFTSHGSQSRHGFSVA